MTITKRGINTEGMDDSGKGIAYWGYNPGDYNRPQTTKLTQVFDATKTALKNNRENVEEAKNRGYAGDWKSTKGVLRAISVVTGVYYTP